MEGYKVESYLNKDKVQQVRILHVFSVMDAGGAETLMMNVYRHINKEKFQFDFVVHTNKRGFYDDEIQALGGKIYRVPAFTGINYLPYQKAWRHLLASVQGKYQIIHSHVRSTASIYLKIARELGTITVSHSHSTSSGKGLSAVVKQILQKKLPVRSDYRFACSEKAGEWLFGRYDFKVVKNAIDAKQYAFSPSVREKMRGELCVSDRYVVGHIGSFRDAKNHPFLVDIFHKIHRKRPDSILLLIGDGMNRPAIEKEVERLGLTDAVFFLGVRADIPNLIQAMDVFLFPSLYEGLGTVLIEVQANGLCAITSDVIPKEVDMGLGILTFVRLDEPPGLWADLALEAKRTREEATTQIKNNGYDVTEMVLLLEKEYLSML